MTKKMCSAEKTVGQYIRVDMMRKGKIMNSEFRFLAE